MFQVYSTIVKKNQTVPREVIVIYITWSFDIFVLGTFLVL